MLTFALFLQLHQIKLQAVFYNHSTSTRNSAAAQMQLHQCKAQLQLLSVYGKYIREALLYLQQALSYIQHMYGYTYSEHFSTEKLKLLYIF